MSASPKLPRLAPPLEPTHGHPGAALAFVADTARRHLGQRTTLLLTIPAPAAGSPRRLLELAPGDAGWWWQPPTAPSEPSFAALGEAHTLRASGEGRFDILRTETSRLWPRVRSLSLPGLAAPAPRLFGGLAFTPGSADAAPWQELGDALFVLPRLLLTRHPLGATTLTVAVVCDAPGARSRLDASLDELERALELLHDGLGTFDGSGDALSAGLRPAPTSASEDTDYVDRVGDLVGRIARGDLQKVVAARRIEVKLAELADRSPLLDRLERMPDATRFALRRPDGTLFLGATPERLIRRRGTRIDSEALAGSIDRELPRAAERLLESAKDRREHELVVRHLVERLRPRCSLLDWRSSPGLKAARRLLHLHTPVDGRTRAGVGILDLVEALHPTPAVGGAPTADALRWIAECEAHPRGWYASAIGWLDAHGDGDFRVALRSALVQGDRAWLWAGAGIVGDSRPSRELEETELKLRAMREVLASPCRPTIEARG